jgi:hypothetical protein
MAMDPVGSLIGSVLLGFGVILLYGSYRNKRVFGADGIIPQALATGSVTDLSEVDTAFEGFGTGAVLGAGGGKQAGHATRLEAAISTIKAGDASLGTDIENRVYAASAGSTRAELVPLAQLLTLAEAKGFRDSVSVIRGHILEVTGERI